MPPFTPPVRPHHEYRWDSSIGPDVITVPEQDLDPEALVAEVSNLSKLYRHATNRDLPETHQNFKSFIRERDPVGWHPNHNGVCFDSLSTRGTSGVDDSPKTLGTALWRTFTGRDLYEWTIRRWIQGKRSSQGRSIISNLSGVVRNGEMMLVLGTPGSGCSTFLKTVSNQHSSFQAVEGFLSFSGLSPSDVEKSFRGEVSYVPEEDEHFPTLTVRQTLDFVLHSKVPKRYHHEIPEYLEMYGKVFGMSHVLDTLVGNDYIRGISGGERKRVSIMEALAVDSAVMAWDNSTRGLDASSAVKYAQSLRIMTDVTGKATFVTLYQVSDAIINLMDKILLLHEGRMIYQGPASAAQRYFEALGFEKDPEQTIADFLTSVTSPSQRKIRKDWDARAPRSAEELETAFQKSSLYANIKADVGSFQKHASCGDQPLKTPDSEEAEHPFKMTAPVKKSRYVPASSSYNTSFLLQLRACMQREWWLLRQHLYPLYIRFIIVIVIALLLGSMFYAMPQNTTGIYSRGGFIFYSSIVVGWVQLAELEGAMEGRGIIARHKRQAIVRPSAVAFAKVMGDLVIIMAEVIVFCLIAYFMAGMRREVDYPKTNSPTLADCNRLVLSLSSASSHSSWLSASPRSTGSSPPSHHHSSSRYVTVE
jgi:ATP-binding cassette, subfamily G (WHITE), member 2, SNQ2